MKEALVAMMELLQSTTIRVAAIEAALIEAGRANERVDEEALARHKALAEGALLPKFSAFRSLIHSLPDDGR